MEIKIDEDTVVCFDLDDTLYNEIDYLISAYKSIAKSIDPENQKILFAKMFSMYRNDQDVFEYLKNTYVISKEDIINHYRTHKPDITPHIEVVKLMRSIKNKGGSIGVITDGRIITQKNKIEALKLEEYINAIIISEEIGVEKPNAKAFIEIENKLKGEKYYYIGDNFGKDFIAPKKMNWETIGIIDNGKNIHSNTYLNIEGHKLPHHLVYALREIELI